jgi:hypothetical protein
VLRVVGNRIMRMNPWAIDEGSSYVSRSGEQLDVDEIGGSLRRMFRTLPHGLQSG